MRRVRVRGGILRYLFCLRYHRQRGCGWDVDNTAAVLRCRVPVNGKYMIFFNRCCNLHAVEECILSVSLAMPSTLTIHHKETIFYIQEQKRFAIRCWYDKVQDGGSVKVESHITE